MIDDNLLSENSYHIIPGKSLRVDCLLWYQSCYQTIRTQGLHGKVVIHVRPFVSSRLSLVGLGADARISRTTAKVGA